MTNASTGHSAVAPATVGVGAQASTPTGGRRRRRPRLNHLTSWKTNLFYLPAVALFVTFVAYPFIRGIALSLTKWNGRSPVHEFVGLDNYVKLISDENFWTAFRNTITYGFGSTLLQNMIGLSLALLLNAKFAGRTTVRTIVYLPVMVAPVIIGYVMYFFVRYQNGALNDILGVFHVAPIDWMGDQMRAVMIITLVNTIQFTGISMVIYLAGLQAIPKMYYEAAELDGAGSVNQFRHITFPMLTPAITSAVIINLIGGLKLFDVIAALAGGGYGTNSLSTLVNRVYFANESAGYASAIGVVTFLFIVVVSAIASSVLSRREVVQ